MIYSNNLNILKNHWYTDLALYIYVYLIDTRTDGAPGSWLTSLRVSPREVCVCRCSVSTAAESESCAFALRERNNRARTHSAHTNRSPLSLCAVLLSIYKPIPCLYSTRCSSRCRDSLADRLCTEIGFSLSLPLSHRYRCRIYTYIHRNAKWVRERETRTASSSASLASAAAAASQSGSQ